MKTFFALLALTAIAISGVVILMRTGTIDLLAGATKNLALAEVRLRLKDINADFEDVTFRYVDPQAKGKSYVCGTVRASYDPPVSWRRFLYTDPDRDLFMSGDDLRLDASIFGICGRPR